MEYGHGMRAGAGAVISPPPPPPPRAVVAGLGPAPRGCLQPLTHLQGQRQLCPRTPLPPQVLPSVGHHQASSLFPHTPSHPAECRTPSSLISVPPPPTHTYVLLHPSTLTPSHPAECRTPSSLISVPTHTHIHMYSCILAPSHPHILPSVGHHQASSLFPPPPTHTHICTLAS